MLGIAIGDTFGVGYEFYPGGRKEIKKAFDFSRYSNHPNPEWCTPGRYTDDTQMSIAIAELLISDNRFNHNNLADFFVGCYKRDPIKGYAGGFQKFLEVVGSGEEFLYGIKDDSIRNGAAMRAIPIGFVNDLKKVIDYAIINAELTHNTPEGKVSSVGIAVAAHYLMHTNKDIMSLSKQVQEHVAQIHPETANYLEKTYTMQSFDPETLFGEGNADVGVPCHGPKTLGAVMYILQHCYPSASEVLKQAVLLGGDTDSVAALAVGLTAIRQDLDILPHFLLDDLYNNEFGKEYLLDLGDALNQKFLS